MPSSSLPSAGATYLDRNARIEQLRQAARRAVGRIPTIVRVILFGSLASGIPTPRSDADLLVEVSSSPHRRPRDRVPEVLLAFRPLPVPLDVLVLTSEEIQRPDSQGSPLLRAALSTGLDLL